MLIGSIVAALMGLSAFVISIIWLAVTSRGESLTASRADVRADRRMVRRGLGLNVVIREEES